MAEAGKQVVTELIVDASGAVTGSAQADAAMGKAEASTLRLVESTGRQTAAWNRLLAAADPVVAVSQKVERAQRAADAAVRVGLTTQETASATVSRYAQVLQQRVIPGHASFAQSTKLSAYEINNLAAQVQDFSVQVASGQSPFLAFFQQASQVQYALGQRGIQGSLAVLRATFPTLLSPIGLGFAAVGAAAAAAIGIIISKMPSADHALQTHEDAIKRIQEAWKTAGETSEQYRDRAITSAQFISNQDIAEQRRLADFQSAGLVNQLEGISTRNTLGFNITPTQRALAQFQPELQKFLDQLHQGKGDVDAFRQAIEQRANLDPMNQSLQDAANALETISKGLADTKARIVELNNIRINSRISQAFDVAGQAGINVSPRLQSALEARTPQAQAAAVSDLFRSYEKATADIIANTDALGLNHEAMISQQTTMELVDQAISKSIQLTPELIDQINKEADARTDATLALEKYKKSIDAMDDIRDSARDLFDTFRDGGNVLDELGKKLENFGENIVFNQLFGEHGQPGSGVLGGWIQHLLTPPAATPFNANSPTAGFTRGAPWGGGVTSLPLPALPGGLPNGMTGAGAGLTGVQSQVYNYFAAKGLSPTQIAGIMGNVSVESGFNPAAVERGGTGIGLFQNTGPRADALRAAVPDWATNPQGQLDFAWQELTTTEKSHLIDTLNAPNVMNSTAAFAGFERPKGYNVVDPTLMSNWDQRLSAAQGFDTQFQQSGQQLATSLTHTATVVQKSADSFAPAYTQGLDKTLSAVNGGGSSGGLFGWLGGIFGGGLSPEAASLGLGGGSGLFAKGGDIPAGSWGIAGERGPEVIRGPAHVYPSGTMPGAVHMGDTHITINGNMNDDMIPRLRAELAANRRQIKEDMRRHDFGGISRSYSSLKG